MTCRLVRIWEMSIFPFEQTYVRMSSQNFNPLFSCQLFRWLFGLAFLYIFNKHNHCSGKYPQLPLSDFQNS